MPSSSRSLTRRLVACGQRLGPVSSRYWWNGSLEQATEWLVLLKTRSELCRTGDRRPLSPTIPTRLPEVVAVDIDQAAPVVTSTGSTPSRLSLA